MAEQYTKVTTTGYGSRIGKSIKGIFLGLILFIASFFILYWNEGRVDISEVAETAVEINVATVGQNPEAEGKLVSGFGKLTTGEKLGDNMLLKPSDYLAVKRIVEMYSWVEHTSSDSETNLGGSETTETTYTYDMDWVEFPADTASFEFPDGHENPPKDMQSEEIRVTNAFFGGYKVNMSILALPAFQEVSLGPNDVLLTKDAVLAGTTYIYKGDATYEEPNLGDLRISYMALPNGTEGTLFGKLEGDRILTHTDKDGNKLYRLLPGTKQQATEQMHSEYVAGLWLFRVIGFLMMWIGLGMFFAPLSVLLDILPVAGKLSRTLVSIVTFIIALVLSIATILISMLLHSIVALIVIVVIVLAIAIYTLKCKAKKTTS